MKIGLIAFSGVRAADPDLNALGLSLPGVPERVRTVKALPSLSLLTLAALTPPEIELEYREIEDLRSGPALPGDYDLVALATFTAQVRDAYRVADHYRLRGVPVVMGGLHVRARPEEALQHCTTIAVGEGESLWPRIIADFQAGRLQRRYERPPGRGFDLAQAPLPRYDLLDVSKYNRLTVQTSRGCPHRCDFCASSILLTTGYKVKPVERVVAEIRNIKRFWPRPFIEFADDNSFTNRPHARELLTALREERVRWFTEADVSIAEDDELLALMRASGCRQVLIGLESPRSAGLSGLELRRNWKLRKLPGYLSAVRAIQAHGITVNGCFILGLDGDDESVFDDIYRFVELSGLFDVQITVLTPFPGTPLYDRLAAEGRLLEPAAWERCTLFDVNFVPRQMSPQRLHEGLKQLARRLYEPAFVEHRRQRFIRELHEGVSPAEWQAA
jgi:radical SAM superfamily enzyme YgiQ (UPF0313 family)